MKAGVTIDTLNKLKKSIQETEERIKALNRASDDYEYEANNLYKTLGDLRTRFDNIAEISLEDLKEVTIQANNALNGFTGGVEASIRIVDQMGGETEILQKALTGLKVAQDVASAFSSFKSGITAATKAVQVMKFPMASLNATMAANPIMAIVAALALLAVGIALVTGWLKKDTKQQKELNTAQEDYNKLIEKSNFENDRELKLAKAQGKSEQELIQIKRRHIQAERDATLALIAKYESYKKLNKEQKENLANLKETIKTLEGQDAALTVDEEVLAEQERTAALKAEEDERNRAKEEANQRARSAWEKRQQEIRQEHQAEIDAEQNFQDTLLAIDEEAEKRRTDALTGADRQQWLQEQIQAQESYAEEQKRLAHQEGTSWQEREKYLENYRNALNATLELKSEQAILEDELALEQEERDAAERERNESRRLLEEELLAIDAERERQKQLELLTDRERLDLFIEEDEMKQMQSQLNIGMIQAELEAEELSHEKRMELLRELVNEQKNVDRLEAQLSKNRSARTKKDQDEQKALKDMKLKLAQEVLSSAIGLLGEETVAGKALALASATINTYQAGTLALASYPPPMNYIALASTIATGLATVKNILSTDVPGASDSTSSSASAVALPSMPELETPIQETHNNLNAADEDLMNQSSRVYLVESDVTQIQSRVKTAEVESTF